MPITTRVDWQGERVMARVRTGGQEASLVAAKTILTLANVRVPLETGKLKNSGKATEARTNKKDEFAAAVSYNTPYAARLHENPQYKFKGKGRGKWLQLAIQENRGRIAGMMAMALRRHFTGKL